MRVLICKLIVAQQLQYCELVWSGKMSVVLLKIYDELNLVTSESPKNAVQEKLEKYLEHW